MEKWKSQENSSRKVFTLSILIATLYAVMTIMSTPISFGIIQVRISDALIPLSYNRKIGKAAIYGTALGAIISNFLGSIYGLPDVVIGALANFFASYSAYILSGRKGIIPKVLATVLSCIIVVFFIGILLFYLVLQNPLESSLIGISIGSIISIVLIGTSLLVALEKAYS